MREPKQPAVLQERPERESVPDRLLFQAISRLEIVRSGMTPEDRQLFTEMYSGIHTFRERDKVFADTENRKKLIALQKKYDNTKTGVYQKVDMTPESLSSSFGNGKFSGDMDVIRTLGVDEVYRFENRVGNWKPVPLVSIQGERFVLKEVSSDYLAEYTKIQEAEHRPEVREIRIEEKCYGLFEFKGDEIMDFTNESHLEQLCEIGIASAKRLTAFDPNQGNLLVENNRLYYIDVGLKYTKSHSYAEAMIRNLSHVVQHIPEVMEKTSFLETILFCIEKFRREVAPIVLAENENAEKVIESEIAPLFWHRNEEVLSPEVAQKIRVALLGLFVAESSQQKLLDLEIAKATDRETSETRATEIVEQVKGENDAEVKA